MKLKYFLCFAFGCLLAIIAYSFRPKPPLPSPQEIQAALSNNAAVYFRAGVLCGVAIDRAKPGLTPAQLAGTARSYFVNLGHDPYLSPPGDPRMQTVERVVANTKRNTNDLVEIVSTNSPATNSP